MIDIDLVTDFTEFQSLRSDWNELRENEPSEDMVFLAQEWFDCWWQAYSKNCRLFVVVARENNQIVGIAPFMISKVLFRGLPLRLLSFIDNGNSAHNNFIINSTKRYEILKEIMDYLLEMKPKWDILELKRIPPESKNFNILREVLRSNAVLWTEKEGTHAPYLKFSSDWQCFFNNLSRKNRKTIRNIENKIKRKGDYHVRQIIDFEEYEKIKSHLYSIAMDSWQERIGNSLNTPVDKHFFNRLSKVASIYNWLLIWILYLNGEPIAFEYHLKYRERIHGLRSSFKKTYRKISPGAFLDYQIIKSLFENGGVKEYDMGGNADFYKRKWTNNFRRHITFHVFTKGLYSKLIYMYEHKFIPILRPLLRRPKQLNEEE